MIKEMVEGIQMHDFVYHFGKIMDDFVKLNNNKQRLLETLANQHGHWNIDIFEEIRTIVRKQLKLTKRIHLWSRIISEHSEILIKKFPKQYKMIASSIFVIITNNEERIRKIWLNQKLQMNFLDGYRTQGVQGLHKFELYCRNERLALSNLYGQLQTNDVILTIDELEKFIIQPKWKKWINKLKECTGKVHVPSVNIRYPKFTYGMVGLLILLLFLNAMINKRPAVKNVPVKPSITELEKPPVEIKPSMPPIKKGIGPPIPESKDYLKFILRGKDTVYSLAKFFEVTEEEIVKVNGYKFTVNSKGERTVIIGKNTVIKIPLQNSRNNQAIILWKLALGEARNEGTDGWAAVCWAAINRMHDRRFPNTISEVLMDNDQFSCFDYTDPNYTVLKNVSQIDSTTRTKCWNTVKKVLDGKIHDPTGGAIFYHALYAKPIWSPGPANASAKIGGHYFFPYALTKQQLIAMGKIKKKISKP